MNSSFTPRDLPERQKKLQPILGIPVPYLFAATSVLSIALFTWPLPWILSGSAVLTYTILDGAARGHRILPFFNIWSLLLLINLTYGVASTSWLLHGVFTAACWPAVFLTCLFQFDPVGRFVRRKIRNVLKQLQFIDDQVAFFDLPALEIDVDVNGLMNIRGMTFSLSSLMIIAHGVEVGIKFSDDMEVAIAVDEVRVSLFRRIDISDVYANVKGGELEMSLRQLSENGRTPTGDSFMSADTPLLATAAKTGDTRSPMAAMTERMTNGSAPQPIAPSVGLKGVKQLLPDDDHARETYKSILNYIHESSVITVSQEEVQQMLKEKHVNGEVLDDKKDYRSAICSQLHGKPTVPHCSKRSIRVSTLQQDMPMRKFLHRLPLLLRCSLNPIAYFHPIYIKSITAGGSGALIESMLHKHIFQDHPEQASDVRNLKKRISAWLKDANFVFEAEKITGMASVPINPAFNILSDLLFDDIMVYRTVKEQVDYNQIVRLGGADARISVPSFLLPHHEHILPPLPTREDKIAGQEKIDNADSQPKAIQAEQELAQLRKDETNVNISAHVRLPACFDQNLLDFIAALVKATKIVEMDKGEKSLDKEIHGFREFTKAVKTDLNDKMRRVAVDAAANDKWIAKLVGKVTKKLETMQGDIGYSGDLPVALDIYRKKAEPGSKLMP
ncbi:hypothetical protein AUEXF2481DRAFT_41064 [Aureobasidium subglaciale EXF-2481]|uniref:Uncharacterized protein n=1 Tax=Aureobasidium subglaciale (strain EXF-2481) TaxID=1043005 RepID=A0A074Y9L7_AURSE|nr:uncharacterized protein AUEXF2481DRAFT_41064 [Aureobasidium subglaciale EXF-2481]KAI5209672.1 hypothetical protein E4T38_02356 [Aureobasidium subglaciale]KAI5228488.1 hypothetical protein E4T40_02135 [Aureobasidium subglaciale]KAI5231918.1 hypothetical protein E4T41_02355 [Aureobasidium subglaciale]KAI5265782.1 hypothetical protein E4T46_02133 [Aureobasidium subglaciale]KEQ94473.1 hypothetical protein AUEXF2481DRAFT_41064 [Aureobasidium subglaciale EXF-2481]